MVAAKKQRKDRILLLEDDPSLGETLRERLAKENYEVLWVKDIFEATRTITKDHGFSIGIFDINLPDGSGYEFAKLFRKYGIPFLFVTALGDAEHRLQGFEIGAEEYIPKPFHLKELLLRVQHVLENHSSKRALSVNGFQIRFASMQIIDPNGNVLNPSPKDFQVLQLLIERSPKVLSREELLDAVWGVDSMGNQRTIDNAIVRVRDLLQDSDAALIRSVRGVGYQWTVDLKQEGNNNE